MKRAVIAGGAFALVLVLLALAAGHRALEQDVDPPAATSPAITPSTAAAEAHQGFLYGRITTHGGATYEGRLRWGGDEEAFWGDYFNGSKHENPWLAQVPPEGLPKERRPIEIFGIKIADRESQIDVGRQLMARFGEIARIEARGVKVVRVTLKSGTVFDLDRFDASDFDDGLRVWDGRRGVVDLDSLLIRSIELLPTPSLGAAPSRLHGTVRTRQGDFTGFVQWDREECVGPDELDGHTADGELSLRFDTIRSIARRSRDSSLVTLLDGREIVLSDTREVGHGNRGIYVDDRRYGRVLISWDAFERVDFSPGGSGPAYGDFPPGCPLTGSVTTRAGRRLAGRLVYDLDESETSETLDAPSQGVDYTIPFGLVASIVPPGREERGAQRARVTLHDGEELQLERTGDLGEGNAGMLIFVDGRQRPEYVPWTDVEQVDFDRPPAMYPPLAGARSRALGEPLGGRDLEPAERPSVTGVDVIGTAPDDLAFNVFMNGPKEGLWLAPHLIGFLDYAPGTNMSVGGGSMAVRLRSERSATSAVEEPLNDADDALNRGARAGVFEAAVSTRSPAVGGVHNAFASGVNQLWLRSAARPGGAAELIVRRRPSARFDAWRRAS